jgi:putative hydroxymethylpyrimidine transport system permease protein
MSLFRVSLTAAGFLALWQMVVWISQAPPYILPGPWPVAGAIWSHGPELLDHAGITLVEILAGLIIGTWFGGSSALLMMVSRGLKRWLMPLLVISQAVPVFALAPLLVLWLGYGLASKIAMAVLIIFFPVTAAFYDGLRRTEPGWLEMARVMDASPRAILFKVRLPAAFPALASGLKVATATAPIGAVVGEWVGSSSGLGFFMLHANARMQVDVMFAALTVLAAMALILYFAINAGLNRLIYWQPLEKEI